MLEIFQLYHSKKKFQSMIEMIMSASPTLILIFIYSASSLKQQSADTNVAPTWDTLSWFLSNQSLLLLFNSLSIEAAYTNFIVFVLTRSVAQKESMSIITPLMLSIQICSWCSYLNLASFWFQLCTYFTGFLHGVWEAYPLKLSALRFSHLVIWWSLCLYLIFRYLISIDFYYILLLLFYQ